MGSCRQEEGSGAVLEIVRFVDTGVGLGQFRSICSLAWSWCLKVAGLLHLPGGEEEAAEAWKQPTCSCACVVVLGGLADGGGYFATGWCYLRRPHGELVNVGTVTPSVSL